MSDTPRYYKWYPTVSCDLGTMPFEGDWTENDKIQTYDGNGMAVIYFYGTDAETGEKCFGRTMQKKVGHRVRTVFEAGVTVYPREISGVTYPVWFMYYGDGVCTVKIPEGETVEEYQG